MAASQVVFVKNRVGGWLIMSGKPAAASLTMDDSSAVRGFPVDS